MIDERAKYLIVNASDITKQLYQTERVAYCNDFDNIYHRVEQIKANEIFARYNVPDEFQKIIVKISTPVFSKKEAEEYTTGFPFNFTTKTITKVNNKTHIRMNNSPIYYDGTIFDDKIVFNTLEEYTSFVNVMHFLEKIYKKGCIENYLQSVKEFLDMTFDFGILFSAWHETHNCKKALTLYKHRAASRRI